MGPDESEQNGSRRHSDVPIVADLTVALESELAYAFYRPIGDPRLTALSADGSRTSH